jgi:hypothetical protein
LQRFCDLLRGVDLCYSKMGDKLRSAQFHSFYSAPNIIKAIKSRRIKQAVCMWNEWVYEKCIKILCGKTEAKRTLDRPRRTRRMQIGFWGVWRIQMAEGMLRWRDLVDAAVNSVNLLIS